MAACCVLPDALASSGKLAAFTSLCLTLSACKSQQPQEPQERSSISCCLLPAACCKVVPPPPLPLPPLMYAHITLPLTRLMSCIAMRRAPDRGLSPQIDAAKRAVITELPQLLLPARNNASFGIYRKNPCGAINQAAAQMEQQQEREE